MAGKGEIAQVQVKLFDRNVAAHEVSFCIEKWLNVSSLKREYLSIVQSDLGKIQWQQNYVSGKDSIDTFKGR